MRRLAPRLLACAWLLAGVAHAQPQAPAQSIGPHPFGVDDLLAHESLGEVTFSPSRRWLVTQSMGPYGAIQDWSLLNSAPLTVSHLDVVDLKAGGPPRRLFADAAETQASSWGYLPGPYSPSGDQMAVTRVRGHDRELGLVNLATGQATWTGLTPVQNYFGATLQWRSDRELLAVTQDPDTPSVSIVYDWQVQARLTAAWSDAAAGRVSVAPIGSGKYLGRHAAPVLRKLVSIDVTTGQASRLLSADILDLALSPGGGKVALLSAEEDVRPDPDQIARVNIPSRRQRLMILDLASHALWRPCSDRDVATGLMAWSPNGDGLLVQAKTDSQPWERAVYWRIDVQARRAAPLSLGRYGLAPDGDLNDMGLARGHWLGSDPLVLVRPLDAAPDTPRRWVRLSGQGAIVLGEGLPAEADQMAAVDQDHVVLGEGQRLWRVSATGRVRLLADTVRPAPRPAPSEGQRPAEPPAPADLILARGPPAGSATATMLLTLRGGVIERALITAPAGETVVAAQARPAALASRARDAQGVEQVWLRQADRAPIKVLTLNAGQADVVFARPRAVRTTGAGGETLTHWLYLPPNLAPGTRAPLVVVPYPGRILPADAGRLRPPGQEYYPSVQILAAAGYAVLMPSLPIDGTREPIEGTADAILSVVDATVAAGEPVDADRLALWGQSYGGYAVLAAASQSPRFKAVIATSASPDLLHAHLQAMLANLTPDSGSLILGGMGWLESGQARMGAPAWREPQRYIRNSPLFAVEKITAPILLVSGDLDGDANGPRAMFNALYRLNKDAILLDYHGEGHVLASAANLRDLYARALAFLADQLPAVAAPPGVRSAVGGSAGDSPPPASGGSAAAPSAS